MKVQKIILIETNQDNIKLAQETLVPAYDVISFDPSDKNLLRKIIKEKPSLIMPASSSGVDEMVKLMNDLRTVAGYKKLPFIFIISLDDSKTLKLLLTAQANEIISSPIRRDQLKFRVESVLKVTQLHQGFEDMIKKLDERVRRKTKEVESLTKKRTLSSVAATVCHNINNSLTIGIANLGTDLSKLTPEKLQKVHKALMDISQVTRKIQQLQHSDDIEFESYSENTSMLKLKKQ